MYSKLEAQSVFLDTLNSWNNNINSHFISKPYLYDKMYEKFKIRNIDSSDENSFCLWTASMFGFTLITHYKVKNEWKSHYYKYQNDTLIQELTIQPNISLREFLESINHFNFQKLISQKQILNFKDNTDDGTNYIMEFVINKKKKVIEYNNPMSFNDEENKRFASLLKIINKYFVAKN